MTLWISSSLSSLPLPTLLLLSFATFNSKIGGGGGKYGGGQLRILTCTAAAAAAATATAAAGATDNEGSCDADYNGGSESSQCTTSSGHCSKPMTTSSPSMIKYDIDGRVLRPKPPPRRFGVVQQNTNKGGGRGGLGRATKIEGKHTGRRSSPDKKDDEPPLFSSDKADSAANFENDVIQPNVTFRPPTKKCGKVSSGWWDGTWEHVYSHPEAPDVSKCCNLCMQNDNCEFFNLQLTGRKECHLMSAKGYFHADSHHQTSDIEAIPIITLTTTMTSASSSTSTTTTSSSSSSIYNGQGAEEEEEEEEEDDDDDEDDDEAAAVDEVSMINVDSLMDMAFESEYILSNGGSGLGENWKDMIKFLSIETLQEPAYGLKGIDKAQFLSQVSNVYTLRAANRNESKIYLGGIQLHSNGTVDYVPDDRFLYGRGKGIWSLDVEQGFAVISLHVFQYRLPDVLPSHKIDHFIFTGAVVQHHHHHDRSNDDDDDDIALSGLLFSPNGDPVGDGILEPTTKSSSTKYSKADDDDGKRQQGGLSFNSYFAVTERAQIEMMKDALIFQALPPFQFPARKQQFSVNKDRYKIEGGGISGVYYYPDWITEYEAESIRQQLEFTPEELWGSMQGSRRSIEWGTYTEDSEEYRGISYIDMPPWIKAIAKSLQTQKIFSELAPVNTARLNYYVPGQGIPPHVDGDIYVPRVAMISLSSSALFRFFDVDGNKLGLTEHELHVKLTNAAATGSMETESILGIPRMSLVLRPRSLVVFEGEAAKKFAHSVAASKIETIDPKRVGQIGNLELANAKIGEKIKRVPRTTITLRHILHT